MHLQKLNKFKIASLITIIALIYGCSVVPIKHTEFDLPTQDINGPTEQDNYRVVFFNASNPLLYPLSGTINIKLNQKHVATLKIGQYIQIFLPPDKYKLYLDHWDVVTWKSDYILYVNRKDLFIKVYAQVTSTGFEIVQNLPEDFAEDYKPAYTNKQ